MNNLFSSLQGRIVGLLGLVFSRDEATLYEGLSVRPSVGRSVGHAFSINEENTSHAAYRTPLRTHRWPYWPCFKKTLLRQQRRFSSITLRVTLCNYLDNPIQREHSLAYSRFEILTELGIGCHLNKANRANDASSAVCSKLCAMCFPRLLKRRDRPTYGRTYGRTDGRTDRPFYRDARMHLKID